MVFTDVGWYFFTTHSPDKPASLQVALKSSLKAPLEKGSSSICKLIEQAGTHLFFSASKCSSCRVVVFNGFTSVPALKSCAIDTDLGTTVGVVTRLTRDGGAGADLGRAGVCSNDASGWSPKCAVGILFWLKKSDEEYLTTFDLFELRTRWTSV